MIDATTADWKLLTDLLEERFGLNFVGARQELLESRLRVRLEALHLDSLRAYYHFLRAHPEREAEFTELSRRLTNNETYFFREAAHFNAITQQIIPSLAAELRIRPLRILSAACSSGEEAYSLAIRLVDAGFELSGIRWEIDACDISPARLEMARQATYDSLSFRACDDETKSRCFREVNGRFEVKERYRRGVRFFHANLAAPLTGVGWGTYDIVICRNMLIYFSETAFDRLIARFAQWIAPGGYLFLGHAESLFERSTDFTPVHLPETMVYRRIGQPA
ncbi:MAG: protein-glutamate O-methyltransferase CheR [Gemmatimonadales bacterium]